MLSALAALEGMIDRVNECREHAFVRKTQTAPKACSDLTEPRVRPDHIGTVK